MVCYDDDHPKIAQFVLHDWLLQLERERERIPRLETDSEIQPKNVTAFMTKMEKYSGGGAWIESEAPGPVQLTWTDTDAIVTDFSGSTAKYVSVLHIDHNENRITIWRVPMPPSLVNFFNDLTKYRLTVSVMGRQYQIEIDWKGRWDTIEVRQVA
jgi:hypothetical protein